jgi:uncharacterized protein (TIGR02117 family)
VAALVGLPLAYAAAALVGSLIPVNTGWRQAESGVRIHVIDNGVHTGISVPANAEGVDWRALARPGDLRDPASAEASNITFGWGDRDFYTNTPQIGQMDWGRALRAIAGLGSTVVHADYGGAPAPAANVRTLLLRPEEYRRLAAVIRATFDVGPDGRAASQHGYGRDDAFYAARGGYNLFNTCNEWTGRALRTAGVRMGAWTPVPPSVMLWL